jgi:hypothetical protein
MAPKKPATFRIDGDLLDALQTLKDRHGIPVTEQVERGLEMWIEAMGGKRRAGEGTKMKLKLMERVSGVGLVTREGGKEIGRRPYDLSVWEERHTVDTFGGRSEVAGLGEVRGSVVFEDREVFGLVGESLVLQLEDGRQFKFFLRNSDGTIAPRGGLEPAEGVR